MQTRSEAIRDCDFSDSRKHVPCLVHNNCWVSSDDALTSLPPVFPMTWIVVSLVMSPEIFTRKASHGRNTHP